MPIIRHATDLERAVSIIRNRAIFGADVSPASLEAYPHFHHLDYEPGRNDLTCELQIELDFECNLEEVLCTNDLPRPKSLYVHFTNEQLTRFWQATLHPDSPAITLVGYYFLTQERDRRLEKHLQRAVADNAEFRIIWNRFSRKAREVNQAALLPSPGWFGRLIGRI